MLCDPPPLEADVFDANALIVLIVLDNHEALARYRTQPSYQSMAAYIQPLGLYPDKMVQFNIEIASGRSGHPAVTNLDAARLPDQRRKSRRPHPGRTG